MNKKLGIIGAVISSLLLFLRPPSNQGRKKIIICYERTLPNEDLTDRARAVTQMLLEPWPQSTATSFTVGGFSLSHFTLSWA